MAGSHLPPGNTGGGDDDEDDITNPLADGSRGGAHGLYSNPGHKGTYTKTFKRKYMHYISNNMDYDGLTKKVVMNSDNTPNYTKFEFDEGYQVIPYKSLRASMTPREWSACTTTANQFKVDKLGYKVEGFNPMQEKMATIAGSATVQSNFVSQPMMMHMVDKENITADILAPQGTANIQEVNRNFQDPCPNGANTIDDCSLPRCIWDLGSEAYSSLGKESWSDWEVSTMNDFEIESIAPGGGASYEWSGGNRWYALGSAMRNSKEYRVTTIESFDEIGCIEAEYKTQTNKSDKALPPNAFIKIAPYHGSEGPITVTAQVMVTYYCTLTFKLAPISFWPYHNRKLTGAVKDSWAMATPPGYNMNHSAELTHWQTGFVDGKWLQQEGWVKLPGDSTTTTNNRWNRRITPPVPSDAYLDQPIDEDDTPDTQRSPQSSTSRVTDSPLDSSTERSQILKKISRPRKLQSPYSRTETRSTYTSLETNPSGQATLEQSSTGHLKVIPPQGVKRDTTQQIHTSIQPQQQLPTSMVRQQAQNAQSQDQRSQEAGTLSGTAQQQTHLRMSPTRHYSGPSQDFTPHPVRRQRQPQSTHTESSLSTQDHLEL